MSRLLPHLFSVGLVAFSIFWDESARSETPSTQPVGRFQIVSGSTAASYGKSVSSATNTLLLDTATGDTWLLWPNPITSGYFWFKVERSDVKRLPTTAPTQ